AQPPDHGGSAGAADNERRNQQMLEDRVDFGPAPWLVDVLGIHQAADGNAQIDVGEIEEYERQQKAGYGEAEHTEERYGVVRQTVLVGRRIDADRKSDDPGEQDRRKRYNHGQPEAVAHDPADGKLVLERISKVALKQAPNPVAVLFDER